uniref:RNA-binding protein, putative n=1 Tax=Theileria annulata TaxID=5874 RepID=A0A3B0MVB7_THEAN
MAPKKTTKPAEVKKAAEPKTKKTTKTTKVPAKTKTPTKTKKTTSKKKVTEEEASVSSEQEQLSEPEYSNQEQSDGYVDYQETEEVPIDEVNQEQSEGEDNKSSVDDEKINANRIFITRIAFEATKDDLEDYFKKFGTVYDAYCPKQNNYSGLNKGFGFISFENEESIKKVFETGPHVIMGREVIVDRATGTKYHSSEFRRLNEYSGSNVPRRHYPPPHRRFRDYYPDSFRFKRHFDSYPDYPNKYPRRERHYERDSYYQNVPPYRQSSNSSTFDPNKPVSFVFSGSRNESRNHDSYSRTFSNGSRNGRDRNAPKLFVGRIGFETSVHSLRSYFSQFGDVIDVYIPKGRSTNSYITPDAQTQKGKGFGFLTFANKSSIHTVLDPNLKHVIDGREIIVDYADVHTRRI